MRRYYFSFCFFLFTLGIATAQIKSTGSVALGDGTMTIKLDLDPSNSKITATLSGPALRWFAVAFGVDTMHDPSDCFLYTDAFHDARLPGMHNPPTIDGQQNWTLLSDTVDGATRTVSAIRDFNSGDVTDYVFSSALENLSVIWAYASEDTTVLFSHSDFFGVATLTFNALGTANFNDDFNHLKWVEIPANHILFIENNSTLKINKIKIFDINAKLQKEILLFNNNPIDVNISDLKPGVYLAEIANQNQKTVKKFYVK